MVNHLDAHSKHFEWKLYFFFFLLGHLNRFVDIQKRKQKMKKKKMEKIAAGTKTKYRTMEKWIWNEKSWRQCPPTCFLSSNTDHVCTIFHFLVNCYGTQTNGQIWCSSLSRIVLLNEIYYREGLVFSDAIQQKK